jgi:hypothetical protein
MIDSLLSLETVLVLAVAYTAYAFISNKITSELRTIPGPLHYALSSIFYNYQLFRGTQLDWALKLHKKYGPIVRIGKSFLIASTMIMAKKKLIDPYST